MLQECLLVYFYFLSIFVASFFKKKKIYLFSVFWVCVAAFGLSLAAASRDSSLVVACGLLLAGASPVWSTGLRAHGLSSYNFELFPGLNHLLILGWLTAPAVLSQ